MTTIRDVFRAQPIAELPPWLAELLVKNNPETTSPDQIPAVELDTDSNIEWAIHYLTYDAPPSIEGKGGEATTLQVAGVLKDHGISEEMARELMPKHYNVYGRCDPLWSLGDCDDKDNLYVKIHNAYTYLVENAPGERTAEAEFGDDPAEPVSNEPDPRDVNFVVLDGMKFSVVRTPRPRRGKKKKAPMS